jgi:hypothetical protein
MPSGSGYAKLMDVFRQIAKEQVSTFLTPLEYATVIDEKTIRLDRDGYPIYSADGDFYVLNGVTFQAGDRVIVSPIGDSRSSVLVLGRWSKSTEVRSRLVQPIYLVPPDGLTTELIDDVSPQVSAVTCKIPFNRKWFLPESTITIMGRTTVTGGTLTVTITDAAKGVLYSGTPGTGTFSVELSAYDFGDTDSNEIEVSASHTDAVTDTGKVVTCVLLVREP